MALTVTNESGNNQIAQISDVAPLVRGFMAFIVKGANRLVELNKDKAQMEILEQLFTASLKADRSDQPEIIEAVLEILLPDDFIGEVSSNHQLPEDAQKEAENWRVGIGDRIEQFRKAKGWTQEELAAAAKIPQSHVSRLENGLHAPTQVTTERIANALGVGPGQIDPNYPACESPAADE